MLRIHNASRNVLHYILKSFSPHSDRDDVMVRVLTEPTNSNTQFSIAVTSNAHAHRLSLCRDTQLPRLPT